MRTRFVALSVLIVLTTSFPASANKKAIHPFFLRTAVTLNGAEIPGGLYNLTLETSNSGVRVTLWKDGQFVATAPASWVKSGAKFTEDAALLRVNSDGSRSLIEIRLAGSAKTIVISNSEPAAQLNAKSRNGPPPPQENSAEDGSPISKTVEKPGFSLTDSPAAGK